MSYEHYVIKHHVCHLRRQNSFQWDLCTSKLNSLPMPLQVLVDTSLLFVLCTLHILFLSMRYRLILWLLLHNNSSLVPKIAFAWVRGYKFTNWHAWRRQWHTSRDSLYQAFSTLFVPQATIAVVEDWERGYWISWLCYYLRYEVCILWIALDFNDASLSTWWHVYVCRKAAEVKEQSQQECIRTDGWVRACNSNRSP